MSRRDSKNYIGDRFGRLIVIEQYYAPRGKNSKNSLWFTLKCDCGDVVDRVSSYIKNGHTTSCGCYQRDVVKEKQRREYVGEKFGRLTAIKQELRSYKTSNKMFVTCICDCGNVIEVIGASLRNGHTQSCGCLRIESCSASTSRRFDEAHLGKRFGALTVVEQWKIPNTNIKSLSKNEYICKCTCDCGTEVILSYNVLKSKANSRSCGCVKRTINMKARIALSEKNKQLVAEGRHHWLKDGKYKERMGQSRFDTRCMEYKEWRLSVFKRDNYTCQHCFCRGGELNAHHIKEKSNYPELKYDVDNGLTLCLGCHKKTDNYGYKARRGVK